MKTESFSQAAYTSFKTQVNEGQVLRAVVKPGRIEYQLKPDFGGQHYYTQATDTNAAVSA